MADDALERELAAIRRQIEQLTQPMAASGEAQPQTDVQATLAEVVNELRALVLRARTRDHDALADSEARTRAIVNTAVDGIITIDDRGIIDSFNPAAERLFGYTASEVIGRNVAILMPLPYREEHDGYINNYLRTGRKKIIGIGREVMGQRQDGTIVPLDLAVSEIRLGMRRLFTGIIHDLTERKEAEEAVRRERDFAEGLVETAPVIVLLLDTEGRIVRFNRFMEEVSGYRLAEVQGRDWLTQFIPERERERIRQVFQVAVHDSVRANVNPIVTKSGTERDIEWFAKALRDADGSVIGVLSIGLDITDRKRAEAQLRELQKRAQQQDRLADIGAITAQIVHDVGNPLAGVSMQAQLILRRAARDGNQPLHTVVQPVEQIFSEARRLDLLIREFMDFSREQHLRPRTMDVHRFLEQILGLWQPIAAARDITLTLDLPGEIPAIVADEDKLRRVFENLVKNAVEAIEKGPGRVTLRVDIPDPENIRISVEDTGPGIPEDLQLFRLFETRKQEGTGLGLAIAKQIVLAHGGRIECVQRHPHGTVFHVELPVGVRG